MPRLLPPLSFALCAGLWLLLGGLAAAAVERLAFDIPGGAAEAALKTFSTQAGRGVIFSTDSLKDVRTNPVRGQFTAREALDRMIAGTTLVATYDARSGAFALRLLVEKKKTLTSVPLAG